MILQKTGFWATLYRSCRTIAMRAVGKTPTRLENTDFCTMARTILIYFPIVLAINIVTVVWVGYFTWLTLVYLLGHTSVIIGIVVVVIAVILMIATGIGLVWGSVEGWARASKTETAQLLRTYVVAKKSAICPLITIQENTDASA